MGMVMINRIWKEETRKTGVNEYTTKKDFS